MIQANKSLIQIQRSERNNDFYSCPPRWREGIWKGCSNWGEFSLEYLPEGLWADREHNLRIRQVFSRKTHIDNCFHEGIDRESCYIEKIMKTIQHTLNHIKTGMHPRENQIQANQSLIQITPCAQTTILFCTSHTKGRGLRKPRRNDVSLVKYIFLEDWRSKE